MRDFYEILGVERNADQDTIKKAYRKLAMQHHPDKNQGNKESEELFKESASAYEVLSDPEKRARYDRFGHQAFQGGGGGFANAEDIFSQFGDIFGDIFGGGRSQQRNRNQPRRGSDLRYLLEISLREVIEGSEKEIEFDTEDTCQECKGTGAAKGSQPVQCQTCHGAGQVRVSQGFFQLQSTCPTCHGQGTLVKDPCKACRGRGRTKQHRKIRLTIPAGVDNGTRLRVADEGEGGYLNGPSGDLYVEIRVAEDERFEREDTNLFADIKIDYLYLLLGGEIEVETVTGKKTLTIPRGAQNGDALKIVGEGVPSLRGSRRGDLYYTLQVQFPEKVSKKEEELLKELAEIRGLSLGSSKSGFFKKK
jgi:molecular chaperone DnaJ